MSRLRQLKGRVGPRTMLAIAVAVIIALGATSVAQQVVSRAAADRDRQASRIADCRSELRNRLLDQPSQLVNDAGAELKQVTAAGLEAVADTGKPGRSAATDEPNPYSGRTLLELRDLSADARVRIATEQRLAENAAAEFDRLVGLASTDPPEYLRACATLGP